MAKLKSKFCQRCGDEIVPKIGQTVRGRTRCSDCVFKPPIMHGFEVETCIELPVDESGEMDRDAAKWRTFEREGKAAAMFLARELVKTDPFGSVGVTEFMREPFEPGCLALTKEYVGDPEYVDRE